MLDDGFADRYGAPAWIADNVLRFAWQGYKRDGVLDGLTIRNDSAKRVGYVKLSALDLIVAFDLPPASETVLRTTAQFVTDEPFIAVEGAFDDGTSIRAASRHFQTVASGSTEYVITITPQATATIERQTPNRTPARQP